MPIYVKADKVKSDHTFTQFPITINDNTDGAVPEWGLFGAGSQSGTPTPDGPTMPTFCGVRTAQLFDISSVIYGEWTDSNGGVRLSGYGARSINMPSNQITVFFNGSVFPYSYSIVWLDGNDEFIVRDHIGSQTQIKEPQTFTPPNNAANFYIQLANGTDATNPITEEQIEDYKLMLNTGSSALPYEPFGWAEKITCAGQTTPVYLGQTQTVRRIKKVVLDGNEPWYMSGNIIYINNTDTERLSPLICTHFPNVQNTGMWNGNNWIFQVDISTLGMTGRDAWIAYLQQQYAAGTPVTVWYVLATPETGIINEPLAKIGDYADELNSEDAGVTLSLQTGTSNTISIESALQPSKMNISYYSEGYTDVKKIPMSNPITVTKTSFPAVIKNNLTSSVDSYVIIGNGSQTGTPTLDNPIQPEFVGVRTANLFASEWEQGSIDPSGTDYSSDTGVRTKNYIPVTPNTIYSISRNITTSYMNLRFYNGNKQYVDKGTSSTIRLISGNSEANPMSAAIGFCCFEIIGPNIRYMRINENSNDTSTKYMMVEGQYTASTIPAYEPYGYKISITNAGQATPVYLGQTQTVRRVRKLVFDGTETGWRKGATFFFNQELTPDYLRARDSVTCICSHYQAYQQVGSGSNVPEGCCSLYYAGDVQRFYVKDSSFETLEDFTAYLAQQYANGTPVVVWYVLAEPETGIVNEPLARIGDYADELSSDATGAPTIDILSTTDSNSISFDSTIQPSSMSLTYKAEVDKVLSSDGTAVYLSSRQ